jgi:quercetin dioxygenase-like cupin family protein
MTGTPIHIASADTDPQAWEDRRGTVRFRILVDAKGGPSEGLVQGIADIASGEGEAMHRHDRPETAYVLSGGGRLTLEGRDMEVHSGDMTFVPAGLAHGWKAGEEGLRVLWSFPGDRFDEIRYDWLDEA